MGLIAWGTELATQWGWVREASREERPRTCVFCEKIGRQRADGGDGTFVHEDDERHGKYDFAPRQTENVPADIKAIGEAHESIPYRRRKHEKEAFYGELLRRIHVACSAFD